MTTMFPKHILYLDMAVQDDQFAKCPEATSLGAGKQEFIFSDASHTFLIYRSCMRRAPARPVRARFVWRWWAVPKVGIQTPHCTLPTSDFALTFHKPHLISSDLVSPHLISPHLISSPRRLSFLPTISHMSSAQYRFLSHAQPALVNYSRFTKLSSSSELCSMVRSFPCQGWISFTPKSVHIFFFVQKLENTNGVFTVNFLHTANLYTQEVSIYVNTYHIHTQAGFHTIILVHTTFHTTFFLRPEVSTHSTLFHRRTITRNNLLHVFFPNA